MRRCPNCESLIPYEASICPECLATDFGWLDFQQTLSHRLVHMHGRKHLYHQKLRALKRSSEPEEYLVRISPFSESAELGFHLYRIKQFCRVHPEQELHIICDGAAWGYAWDYAADSDPQRDFYLPPSLPLPSLVEVSRFILALEAMKKPNLKIRLILPPPTHAATKFIEETRLISMLSTEAVTHASYAMKSTRLQGCDDVLVPLNSVGSATNGQLAKDFHERFNRLAAAGKFERRNRTALRQVVMEAAENADIWGGGGWVVCFLRQEKRGAKRFGHRSTTFSPARETHLFIHVFSIGYSLADTLDYDTEWEAVQAVTSGKSSRTSGGGRGLPSILHIVTQEALGTVCIVTGNYTHIVTPDGIVRAFHSAGSDYLPGVHISAIVPLAVISQLDRVTPTRLSVP